MYQNERTIKTYEVKTLLPPSPTQDQYLLEQLQTENSLLKQDLTKQIQISQQLELKARDLNILTHKFEEIKINYSETVAKNRSLEIDNEGLLQKIHIQEQEIRNLKKIIQDRGSIDNLLEKTQFQEKRIEELLKELENWKLKYQEIGFMKEKEIEELKVTITANSQVNFEKNIGFLKGKYENEMEKLNLEIKRLTDILQGKTMIIEGFKSQEDHIRFLEIQLSEKNLELTDIQAKSNLTLQENNEIAELNKALTEEISLLKDKILNFEDFQRIQDKFKEKIQENEFLIIKINDLESKLKNAKSYEEKLIEYENKIAMLASELERTRGLQKIKEKNFNEFQEKYQKLEAKYTEALTMEIKFQEAEKALELHVQKANELNLEIANKNEVIIGLEARLEQISDEMKQIDDLKAHISIYELEAQRSSKLLEEKLQEIQLLIEENLKYETLLSEKRLSEALQTDYEERITLLIRELDELRSQYLILETSIYSVTEYEVKNREFERRISDLTLEIEELYKRLMDKDRVIEEMKGRYEEKKVLEEEKVQWEEDRKEFEGRYNGLKKELETLRKHSTSLEVQISVLLEKIGGFERDFVEFGIERETLLRNNKELMEKILRLESMLREYRIVIEEKEYRLKELEGNMSDLHQNLKGKHEEVVKMKGFIDTSHEKLSELETLKRKINAKDDEIKLLFRENENLRLEIKQLKNTLSHIIADLEEKNRENEGFKTEMKGFFMDLDSLKQIIKEKEQEIEKKNDVISVMEKDLRDLVIKLEELDNDWSLKYQKLEEKVILMTSELERLKNKLLNKDQEIEILKKGETISISNEKKIGELLKEIENLKLVLKTKETEIIEKSEKITANTLFLQDFEKLKKDTDLDLKGWRDKHGVLDGKMSILVVEYQKSQEEISRLKKEIEMWKIKYESQENVFNEKILGYENKVSLLVGENERLRLRISKKDGEFENQMRVSGEWGIRIRKAEEIEGGLRIKIEEFTKEIERFTRRNQQQLLLIVILYTEIERLRMLAGL